jgi:hypothetical protein
MQMPQALWGCGVHRIVCLAGLISGVAARSGNSGSFPAVNDRLRWDVGRIVSPPLPWYGVEAWERARLALPVCLFLRYILGFSP